ncbi:hypothetical protein EJ03DRAFT_158871 [Teratosphaeria nubilosa]|uniref:Uncharacterized protein n=1 Tax=Teratosphaeria nubilosa TaxID=161662 RepID=A0A6G1L515_9PEZI|nr:hypothetical protein EJ03DRAFT_158871 [Teratosphaeria nubilosa]
MAGLCPDAPHWIRTPGCAPDPRVPLQCTAPQSPCVQPDCGLMVCGDCRTDQRRMLLFLGVGPPMSRANDIGVRGAYTPPAGWSVPNGTVGPAPPPPWAGWLTRFCTDCEKLIQSERRWGLANPSTNPCACRIRLDVTGGAPTMCWPHHLGLWVVSEANRLHNDNWLRRIERDKSGSTIVATSRTQRQRARNGTYRACRCGRTTKALPDRPPGTAADTQVAGGWQELWECMNCEGYFSACPVNDAGSKFFNRWFPARKFNRGLRKADYSLGRRIKQM